MKELYIETFDSFTLSDEKRDEIRCSLLKNKAAKTPRHRRITVRIAAVAAAFLLMLLVIPNTNADIAKAAYYMTRMFSLADGTEVALSNDGNSTEVSFDAEAFVEDKFYEISDGKIYFAFGDTHIDITDKCSATTFYRYDLIDDNGYTHIIFVGGNIENLGWAEFVFDEDGTYLTNLMSVPEDSQWLENAMLSIGVPTGNPELDFPD